MRKWAAAFLCCVGLAGTGGSADSASVLESSYSPRELALEPDPASAEWIDAPRVFARMDKAGQPIDGPPTEIRSRWTWAHLYLLYSCPYKELNLKPDPVTGTETPRLWNWDVAEAFIGSDYERIGRYREFQVSPQSEWVDLDIDRDDPKGQKGISWNSGYAVKARIDVQARVWHGIMRIPFGAIDTPCRSLAASSGLASIESADLRANSTTPGGLPAGRPFMCPKPSGRYVSDEDVMQASDCHVRLSDREVLCV